MFSPEPSASWFLASFTSLALKMWKPCSISSQHAGLAPPAISIDRNLHQRAQSCLTVVADHGRGEMCSHSLRACSPFRHRPHQWQQWALHTCTASSSVGGAQHQIHRHGCHGVAEHVDGVADHGRGGPSLALFPGKTCRRPPQPRGPKS